MEFLIEMSRLELFTQLLVCSKHCDERIEEWDNASTAEECELAEDLYYSAQEQWSIFMQEVKRRGIISEYEKFCQLVVPMGLL